MATNPSNSRNINSAIKISEKKAIAKEILNKQLLTLLSDQSGENGFDIWLDYAIVKILGGTFILTQDEKVEIRDIWEYLVKGKAEQLTNNSR